MQRSFSRYIAESLEQRVLLSDTSRAVEVFNTSPAVFVENRGLWADESVRFVHQGSGANVAITDRGPVFELFRGEANDADELDQAMRASGPTEDLIQTTRFSVHFQGANAVAPVGQDQSETAFNYFIGDQSTWRSGVPGFNTVVYPGLYPGIDLHTWGQRDSLKYEFHVAPGTDWRQIAIRYDGIEGLKIAGDGSLLVNLAQGWETLRDDAPYVYQEIDGQRVAIASSFVLVDEFTYVFRIEGYDPSHALIIDPDLAWATYLGGSDYGTDQGYAIATDAAGNALLTGYSNSLDFTGANNAHHRGIDDAFVAKVSTGGTLAWATYLGGIGYDYGYGIATDAAGNALVTGITTSPDFAGANNTYHGIDDAFVAKVSGGGTLVWATYLGGGVYDRGRGITTDAAGDALVTGYTTSTNFDGANNTYHGGFEDAFVAKVSGGGTLAWATYLGGNGDDRGYGIARDASGNALVTGYTSSANVAGASNTHHGGVDDAFVAKVSAGGTLTWATYLGGIDYDHGYGIAIDAAGNALVTGETRSTNFDGANNTNHGSYDAFVAKVSYVGTLAWASYLGGSGGQEQGRAITTDAAGNVLVTGYTNSTNFAGANNAYYGGTMDAFVAKVRSAGALAWAMYLGGSSLDHGFGIATDAVGNALVTGNTSSTNFAGANNTNHGGADAFVAKINEIQPSWVVAYYLAHGGNLDTYQAGKFSEIANGVGPSAQPVVLYDFLEAGTQDAVFEMSAGLTDPLSYMNNTNMWWTTDLGLAAEANMGDGATLSTFMNWVIDHYPADHYALVLFDHGSGWESETLAGADQAAPIGICWDGADYLTTGELGTAFAQVESHRGSNIDVTHLDACLMQMVEVAYEIYNSTDYLIGNANLGWVSTPFSFEEEYLDNINAATTPLALATDIATQYHDLLAGWPSGQGTDPLGHAVSVLDMRQIGGVYSAMQTLGSRLISALPSHASQIVVARVNTQKYDENNDGDQDIHDPYIDLKHFAQRIQSDVTGSDTAAVQLRSAAQAVETAMDALYIRYNASANGRGYTFPNATGQSIYFPENDAHAWYSSYNASVLAFCEGNWDEFLHACFGSDLLGGSFSISPNSNVSWGSPIQIDSRIRNAGGRPVTDVFSVDYYLSNDTVFDTSDVGLWNYDPNGHLDHWEDVPANGLGPNYTRLITLPAAAPSGFSGTGPFYVVMQIDSWYEISETEEGNNFGQVGQSYDWDSFTVIDMRLFQTQQTFAAGNHPKSVAISDLNADGKLDLVTANDYGSNVSVLLANGSGTFQTHQTFATGVYPQSVAVSDLNADGNPDIVTANSGALNVSVLLGNGTGTFQTHQTFATDVFPQSVAVSDLNADGKPDIVTANRSDNVSVLLGNGDGTFQTQQTFAVGDWPDSVAISDLNADGKPDLVTANHSDNVSVLLGNGDGTFQGQQTFAAGDGPCFVSISDLNADGRQDLVTANAYANNVSVLLGNGDGTFRTQQTFAAGDRPYSVSIFDLNADGKLDLVTANAYADSVSVLLGYGNGTFQTQQDFAVGDFPQSVAIADLNADAVPDLVTANEWSGNVSVLMGNANYTGSGTFPSHQMFAAGDFASSVVTSDLNRDGKLDLVTANAYAQNVSVLLGTGTGTFQAQHSFGVGQGSFSVATSDVNTDGKLDLVTANAGSNSVSVLLGNGDGTFQAQQTFSTGYRPLSIATSDLNADGHLDLVTANADSDNTSVLLGRGDGTFQIHQVFAAGDYPRSVVICDLNGDGKPDLVTANLNAGHAGNVSVLLGNGNGTFRPQQIFATGDGPSSVAVADLNRDGKRDLVTANYMSDDVSVLLGRGDGTFEPQQTSAAGNGPYSVAIADLNADGKPDLVTANAYSNTVSVLRGNGNGTFQTRQTFAAGNLPYSVAISDLNADSRPDLVTANALSDNVSVLLNIRDVTPPTVIAAAFEWQMACAVQLTFDEPINTDTLTASDVVLRPLAGGPHIPATSVSYDPATQTATFGFASVPADGSYTAILPAGSVADINGNLLAADYVYDEDNLFILRGDCNRDRQVTIADLGDLASNWQKTGAIWSDGDFNYDGIVSISDLGDLASNWQAGVTNPLGMSFNEAWQAVQAKPKPNKPQRTPRQTRRAIGPTAAAPVTTGTRQTTRLADDILVDTARLI